MRIVTIAVIIALMISATNCAPASQAPVADQARIETNGPPDGQGSYEGLVALFSVFHEWKTPKAVDGNIDYSPEAVDKRRAELRDFQAKLPDFSVAQWDRHQQVDYLAVRAQMDLQDFTLNVTKPWARDPGMYIDKVRRLAYTELPLTGDALTAFREQLRTIPTYFAQAQINRRRSTSIPLQRTMPTSPSSACQTAMGLATACRTARSNPRG
jgi:hypothetical protein